MDLKGSIKAQIFLPTRLYHGTSLRVTKKELAYYKTKLLNGDYWQYGKDFGLGFYTTHLIEQAKTWAVKSVQRQINKEGIDITEFIACVMVIKIIDENLKDPTVLHFTDASERWAKFIYMHRLQTENTEEPCNVHPDIVIGYMADNNTGGLISRCLIEEDYTFQNFFHDIQVTESGDCLTMDRLGNQYAFCSETLNDSVVLEGCYLREKGEWNYYEIDAPYLSAIKLL
ncbi:DUF3990 domain-containing protein [Brevibacillus halotolerans]|nr:DUF3990 domain-containing protein [Brevibacillus halotolerans]